jgi:hypothetical protein
MALAQQQNRWKCGRFIPVLTVLRRYEAAHLGKVGLQRDVLGAGGVLDAFEVFSAGVLYLQAIRVVWLC